MKHFLAIVYMVFCGFVVKAQEKEPWIYYMDYNKLYGYNYISEEKANLGEIFLQTFDFDASDWSAFDTYNGRFFCISSSSEHKFNPFQDDTSMVKKCFVVEVDVKSQKIKYHKLPFKDTNTKFVDLHYDPVKNSLVYHHTNRLNNLDLNTGIITEISTVYPTVNYNNLNQTLYIPEKQQYLYGRSEISLDTQYVYYIYDLKNQFSKKLFSSSVIVINFVYSRRYGLYGFTDYSNINKPHEIVSISESGQVTILDSISSQDYLWYGQNSAVFNDKYLLLNSRGYDCLHFNLETKKAEYIKRQPILISTCSEFHTFNQPYIQTSENTYTSTYGKSYSWLWNNRPIENSNTQTYTPTQCGDYKVEVTHLDGRIDTSETVHYEAKDAKGNLITNTFATAFPNPFRSNLNVQYKTCLDNEVTFKVFDLQGKLVYTHKTAKVPAGEHAFEWNSQLQNLRYGLYTVQIFSGSDLISTQKVVKL